MKKLILCLVICLIAVQLYFSGKSDDYIKHRVVKLVGPKGTCSGEQVHAPSGQDYILSAGHCRVIAQGDSITIQTEEHGYLQRRIIAEDPLSDLLLIEGLPHLHGLDIADSDYKNELVRTFTHGSGMDTYETVGYLIQDLHVKIFMGPGSECAPVPKFETESTETLFGGREDVCVLSVDETVSTAKIVPGSSGGLVVNASGELVGVASATDGYFGMLVRLGDIKHFLSTY